MSTFLPGLPSDAVSLMFEFDSTYHKYFTRHVLCELRTTFILLTDIIALTSQFVYYPKSLDRYVRTALTKKDIANLTYFTRAVLPKHYNKKLGYRMLLFFVFSDCTSLGYKMGYYKLKEDVDWTF